MMDVRDIRRGRRAVHRIGNIRRGRKDSGWWKTKDTILTSVILATVILCVLHLNGWSADLSDREMLLIITDSMDGEPMPYDIDTIEKDSMMMVRLIGDEEKRALKEGDVISFWYMGLKNHHRVVYNDTGNGIVVTKGDNAGSSETVDYDDVRGVVVGKDRYLGTACAFIKENLILCIACISALFIFGEIRDRIRHPAEEGIPPSEDDG